MPTDFVLSGRTSIHRPCQSQQSFFPSMTLNLSICYSSNYRKPDRDWNYLQDAVCGIDSLLKGYMVQLYNSSFQPPSKSTMSMSPNENEFLDSQFFRKISQSDLQIQSRTSKRNRDFQSCFQSPFGYQSKFLDQEIPARVWSSVAEAGALRTKTIETLQLENNFNQAQSTVIG
jgi:hypothetical protein